MKNITQSFQKARYPIIVLAVIIIAAIWVGNASAISKKKLRRINKEGPVTITATYQNPLQEGLSEITFNLQLDTHSVNLDQYQLNKLSFIKVNNGELQPALSWQPKGASHHYKGTLEFAGPAPDGMKSLQLIVRGVGGVEERIFDWQLPIR